MDLVHRLHWVVAKKPPKWGRKTTKEEREEQLKEKHTPGKKKKMGRQQIEAPKGKYGDKIRPDVKKLEKGKRCGKSYIAKEDECNVGKHKPEKGTKHPADKAPKKPRTRKPKPQEAKPKVGERLPPVPQLREQRNPLPKRVNSPEGGKGLLVDSGYLSNGRDGVYELEGDPENPHRIYFPKLVDQAQAQYVTSAIADLMGLVSPEDYLFRNTPFSKRIGAGHPMQPYAEMDEWQLKQLAKRGNDDIAAWFIHSVLTRHDDVIGRSYDNMVMRPDGRLMVLHFGGSLLWDSLGKRRLDGMSPDKLGELEYYRTPDYNWEAASIFQPLPTEAITKAVREHLATVEEQDILDLVEAARFQPEDRNEIGGGLIARKRLLESQVGEPHV